MPALFHIYGKHEYVGLIERSNRTVKYKARTMTHATPYKQIPILMSVGLLYGAMNVKRSKVAHVHMEVSKRGT